MTDKFVPNNPTIYNCIDCNYITHNKKDYIKHNDTRKHLILTGYLQNNLKNPNTYNCDCGKNYKHRQSLYNHKKLCNQVINFKEEEENVIIKEEKIIIKDNNESNDALIQYLINENKEFKNLILELAKKDSMSNSNNINNIHTNSHNKTFNLQFFLNETCKDAMNMSDFINSLTLQLSDLENVGKLGFVDGISNIIIKNLEALDVEKRPVHCCDSKRETMYIKDQDKWEKDDNEMKRTKELVRNVRDKNI